MNNSIYQVCLLLFAVSGANAQTNKPWEFAVEKEGICVYTRLTNLSPIKQMRVTAELNTSVDNLLRVLNDVKNYPKWVYKCSQAERVKTVGKDEFYYRTVSDLPWPVCDRDVVLLTRQWKESDSDVYHTHSTAQPDFMVKKEDLVRVPLYESNWTITPINSNTVKIEYIALTEAGGDLPDWLVNMGLTSGPLETIRGLRKYFVEENE